MTVLTPSAPIGTPRVVELLFVVVLVPGVSIMMYGDCKGTSMSVLSSSEAWLPGLQYVQMTVMKTIQGVAAAALRMHCRGT